MATLQFPVGISQLLLSMGIAGIEPKWNFSVSPGKVSMNLTWEHVNTGTIAPGPPPGISPVPHPVKQRYFSAGGNNFTRHLPPRFNKKNRYHETCSRSEKDLQWRESPPPDTKMNHTIPYNQDSNNNRSASYNSNHTISHTCSLNSDNNNSPDNMPDQIISHSLDSDRIMKHFESMSHAIELDNIEPVTDSDDDSDDNDSDDNDSDDNDSDATVMQTRSICTYVKDIQMLKSTDILKNSDHVTVINSFIPDFSLDKLGAHAQDICNNLPDDNESIHHSGSESMSCEKLFDREGIGSTYELSDDEDSHVMYTHPDNDCDKIVSDVSLVDENICGNVSESEKSESCEMYTLCDSEDKSSLDKWKANTTSYFQQFSAFAPFVEGELKWDVSNSSSNNCRGVSQTQVYALNAMLAQIASSCPDHLYDRIFRWSTSIEKVWNIIYANYGVHI